MCFLCDFTKKWFIDKFIFIETENAIWIMLSESRKVQCVHIVLVEGTKCLETFANILSEKNFFCLRSELNLVNYFYFIYSIFYSNCCSIDLWMIYILFQFSVSWCILKKLVPLIMGFIDKLFSDGHPCPKKLGDLLLAWNTHRE